MSIETTEKPHIAYLDSVRGLAALSVVSEHFVIAYGLPCTGTVCSQLLDYSPLHIWWDGTAAVSMFFVLSGLVLSFKYFREGHSPHLDHFLLRRYMVNRLFRIWPPYCAVLLFSALLYQATLGTAMSATLTLPPDPWISQMWQAHALSWGDIGREAFLPRLPATIVLIPQAWTLTLELVLSLLLPVGLLLLKQGLSWLLILTLLLVAWLDVPVFLVHFLLGLLLARHIAVIARHLQERPLRRRVLLMLGILLYTVTDIHQGWLSETGLWLISGLGAVLILMFVSGSRSTQQMLSWPGLHMIGKVSYSVYLIHIAVLICLIPPALQILEPVVSNRLGLWLCGWLLTMGLSVGIARFSYHYMERPSMALGRHLGS